MRPRETRLAEPNSTGPATIELKPSRGESVRKAIYSWGIIFAANIVFLVIASVLFLVPGTLREGGSVPVAVALVAGYILIAFTLRSRLPIRPVSLEDGVLHLPRPVRTRSGAKMRDVPLAAVKSIRMIEIEGLPATEVSLHDGNSLVVFDLHTGRDGRMRLEALRGKLEEDNQSSLL